MPRHNTSYGSQIVFMHIRVGVHQHLGLGVVHTKPLGGSSTSRNSDAAMVKAVKQDMDCDAKAALAAVTIRGRDTLMFDQVKQQQPNVKHWRHLLTDELWEPKAIPMTSACMVLESYLLFASNDGVLRAHPRGNPKSTYHIEELQSLVPHMTSSCNVIALIHSYDTLEVRHVEKQAEDPFLRFRTLFQTKMVDASHSPLLYGPYIIFRSLDGAWYRIMYDTRNIVKEPIKIPFKAAWAIVSLKNANWRSWTVALKVPQQQEEYVLIATGETK